jgi:hypothetical protein
MTRAILLAALVALAAPPMSGAAQGANDRQALGRQIEQRFDVLPVQGGIVLRPKAAGRDVRSVELMGGAIFIDGQPVSGAELKRRLGADADSIIRLSYLDASEQRALFEASAPPASPGPAPTPTPPSVPGVPETTAPPAAPAEPAAPNPQRRPRRSSDRVRIGGGVDVGKDEIIDGDVVAIGGGANVDGTVHGDVVAIGGGLNLGPNADINGDATVVGGALHRDPAARVGGDVKEVGWGDVNLGQGNILRFGRPRGDLFFGSALGSMFALVATVTRVAILCILTSLVLLFGRGYVERVSLRAASEPVKAGAIGLLIQLLFFPVLIAMIVMMVITIIGIPLLVLVPFALLGLALVFLIGFTAVTYDIGRLAIARFGWGEQNPYVIAAIGIALVVSPLLLSRIVGFAGILWPITWTLLFLGLLSEYVAWTVGLGAVALARFAPEPPVS